MNIAFELPFYMYKTFISFILLLFFTTWRVQQPPEANFNPQLWQIDVAVTVALFFGLTGEYFAARQTWNTWMIHCTQSGKYKRSKSQICTMKKNNINEPNYEWV